MHSLKGQVFEFKRRARTVSRCVRRRNLLIYGAGGVILPFVGIKLIDLVVHNLFGA